MFANNPANSGDTYVDRGFIDGWDFDENDIIADATWRTLDISHIVPAGERLVHLTLAAQLVEVGIAIIITKPNGTGNANHWRVNSHGDRHCGWENGWIMCSADGKIGYLAYPGTWEVVHLSVRGWLI